MDKEYEYGLGAIRFVAMLCIVICHIFQFCGNRLAFYFNAGVPVFLCLSGYLFGKREIRDLGAFFKSRSLRILVPYYLMLGVILTANAITGTGVSAKELLSSVLCQQWYQYSIPFCGHLWYITCILGCYLMIPALQWFCSQLEKKPTCVYWLSFCVGFAVLWLLQFAGGKITGVHYYGVFAFGYFYAAAARQVRRQPKPWMINAAFGFSIAGFLGMYLLELLGFTIPGMVFEYYKIGLAAVSCLFFINNSKRFSGRIWKPLLRFGDKYSYAVYLVHHIFILGALSVLRLTGVFAVNVLLAMALTAVCAVGLHTASELIIARIKKER